MAEPEDMTIAIEAVKAAPEDDAKWDHVEEVLDAVQRPTDVSELFTSVLSEQIEPELASNVGQRAVRFYESWYGEDSAELPTMLERVLKIDPDAEWAFERLTVAYTGAEQWDKLLDAYDGAIEGVDQTSRRITLLDEAAQAAKDFAGDLDRAIGYMQQLFALDPSNVTLASSLERLLERQKRWPDLLALLEQRIEVQTKKQVRTTRVRMGNTYLEKLDDAASALGQAKLVLADAADNKQGFELVESVLAHESGSHDTRREALDMLKAHYVQKNKPKEVVRVLEVSLSFAEADESRTALREIVERLVDLGDDEAAMPHQASLLIIEPMPQEREALRALAERTRDFARYVEAIVTAADACEPGTTQHELRLEAARAYEESLQNVDRAIELYATVFNAEQAGDLVVQAGRRLLKLLEGTDRDQETLAALSRMSELEADDNVRRSLLGKVARMAEKLGDTSQAQVAWAARVSADDADVEALDALVQSAEAASDHERLASLLARRVAAPGAADRRRDDLKWLARLQAGELEQLDEAIETWRRIQSQFGEDRETVNALTDLLSRAERWQELAHTLSEAAGGEVERFAQLQTQLGDAYRERLGKPQEAVTCYRAALYVDPTHEGARAGQSALVADPECVGAAVESLIEAYGQTDEWENILSLLEPRLASETSGTVRAEVLIEAAELNEDRKEDAAVALDCYRRAFALIPDDRATEREIRRLAESLGAWDAVIGAYRETIASFDTETPRVAQLRFDEGAMLEQRLDDKEAALVAYEQAAAIAVERVDIAGAAVRCASELGRWDGACERAVACMAVTSALESDVLGPLETGAAQQGAWDALTESMTRALGGAGDAVEPAVMRALHARVGAWHQEQRDDIAAAEMALIRAVEAQPDHANTLGVLAGLQRQSPGKPLIDTLLKLADTDEGNLDPVHEAAEVALEALEADEKLPILQRLGAAATRLFKYGEQAGGERDAQSSVRWAVERMVEINRGAGEHRGAFELVREASTLPFEADQAQVLRHEAARIAIDGMGDSLLAIQIYRDVLQIDPGDSVAMQQLGGLYRTSDRLPELLMLLRHELGRDPSRERKIELRLEVVGVLGEMEARGGRLESLEANLEEQPGHPPTLEAITEFLAGKARHAELAAILGGQATLLSRGDDPTQSAALWRQAARLYETDLADADSAIEAYRKLHDLEPTGDATEALARIYTQRGEHGQAAQWLELRLGTAPPDTRAVTAVELARAHVEAGQLDRARGCLEQALAQEPSAHEARALLAELYRRADSLAQLAALLVAGAEHVEDDALKLAYLKEAAELYYDKLDDPQRAIPALETARALAPGERRLGEMLARGLQMAQRHDDARALLQELISSFGRKRSSERAELHYRLAEVAASGGDTASALSELETATKMNVAHVDAMRMLAELSRKSGDLDRSEKAYRSLLMAVRRNAPTGLDETGPSEVFFELYGLANERGETDKAEELLESALESATQTDDEARRFQRALLDRDEVDVLLRVIDTRLELVSDKKVEAEILAVRAQVLHRNLQQSEDALDAAIKSIELDPRVDEVHVLAREVALATDQLPRYIERMSKLAEAAGRKRAAKDKRLSAELTLRMGELIERDLEDYDRAAGLYAKVESTGELIVPAALAMARVAGARGEAAEQRRVLKGIAELSSDEITTTQRNDANYLLAELCLSAEEERADGLAHLSSALEAEPDYARAKGMLVETLASAPQDDAVLGLFERVARASRDDEMLLDWMDRRIALPDATPDDIREGAELAMNSGRVARAESLLGRAAKLTDASSDGGGAWVFSGLARCRLHQDDKIGAIQHMQGAVEHASEADAEGLLRELATLAASNGGDLEAAARAYERLLERDSGDRTAWEPLLDVLGRIGNRDRFEAFVGTALEALLPAEDRAQLQMAQASFLIEVAQDERAAVPVLQTLLEEEPTNISATDLLTGVYQRNGMNEALAELLSQQYDRARDEQNVEAIAEIGLRLGDLYEDDRVDDALDIYRSALEWSPQHRGLLRSLLRRMGDEAEPRDRAEVMHTLLGSEEGTSAAGLAQAVISLWQDLGDDERVQEALEMGYRAHREDASLRDRLEGYYVEREMWAPLANFMMEEAERVGATGEAVGRYKNAANLFREQLDNTTRAADALRRALEIVPDDLSLLGELARNLASAGQYGAAIEDVTRLLDGHPESDGVRVDLLRVRADLALGNETPAEAVADLEAAYAISGTEAQGDLLRALEVLHERAISDDDLPLRRQVSLRRVAVLDETGDAAQAREVLAVWVDADTSDVDSLRALRDRDLDASRWEDVAQGCERLIDVETGDGRIEAALGLAQACTHAERPADAREGLERVYQESPENPALRGCLRTLYESIGALEELAALLVKDAEYAEDPSAQVATYQRAAELYIQMEQADAALEPLGRARELQPDDPQTAILMIDIHVSLGQVNEALGMLQTSMAAMQRKRSPELARLQQRMARLARAQGDTDAQLQWLGQALDTDRKSGEIASELTEAAMAVEDYDAAMKALRTITMMEDPLPITRAMAFLKQAQIAIVRGDTRRAQHWARKAKSLDDDLTEADAFLEQIGA